MPASSVNINGNITRQPGIYGTVNASALSAGQSARGTIIVTGPFPRLKPKTIYTAYSSPKTVKEWLPEDGPDLCKFLFNPSKHKDNGVKIGGASVVKFCSASPSTRATMDLNNSGGINILDVSSFYYGIDGNRVKIKVESGTNKGRKYTVVYGTTTEVFDDIGGDNYMSLVYGETEAGVMKAYLNDPWKFGFSAFDLGTENLSETAFTTAIKWTAGADFAYDAVNDEMDYMDAAHAGTLTQASGDFATAASAATLYRFGYSVKNASGFSGTATITTAFAESAVTLDIRNGVREVTFKSAAAPGDFVISVTSAAGSFSLDDVSLRPLTSSTTNVLTVEYEISGAANNLNGPLDGKTYTPSKMTFDGPLTIHLSAADTGTAVVTGSLAGTAKTDILTWTAEYSQTTANSYDTVTSIVFTGFAGGSNATVAGRAFNMSAAEYDTVEKIVDRVNTHTGEGFTGTKITGATNFAGTHLDYATAQDITATKNFTAGTWQTWDALDGNEDAEVMGKSSLIKLSIQDYNGLPTTISYTYLAGAVNGTESSTTWEDAFIANRYTSAEAEVAFTDNATYHALFVTHLDYMAGLGQDERNGFVGCAANVAKATIKTSIAALNSEKINYSAQEVKIYSQRTGLPSWYAPKYLAVAKCAMQAGATIGLPLTEKTINILDYRQHTGWNPNDDAEEMLIAGLSFLYTDRYGIIKFKRNITTYTADDNPIYTETSSMLLAFASIRDMRQHLQAKVGTKNTNVFAQQLFDLVGVRLDDQKNQLGILKNFDPSSIAVTDLGDRFDIQYTAAVAEPVNFILLTINVDRNL